MTRGKLVVLGLAFTCLLAGLPAQPREGAVLDSPGLCPVVCPMTCPSTWTCNFGNCLCD